MLGDGHRNIKVRCAFAHLRPGESQALDEQKQTVGPLGLYCGSADE